MRNSAHHENILISGKDNFEWTDFSDHLALNGNDLEYNTPDGIKDVVRQFFYGLSEVPGITSKDEQDLKLLLNKLLREKGIEIVLEPSDDYAACAEKLWESVVISKVYKSRKENSFALLSEDNLKVKPNTQLSDWEDIKPNLLKAADKVIKDRGDCKNIVSVVNDLKLAIKSDKLFDAYESLYKLSQIEMGLHLPFAMFLDFASDIGLSSVTRAFEAEEEFINEYAIATLDSNLLNSNLRDRSYKSIQGVYNDGVKFLEGIKDSISEIISLSELPYYK